MNPFFIPPGAKAFPRDNPNATVQFSTLDTSPLKLTSRDHRRYEKFPAESLKKTVSGASTGIKISHGIACPAAGERTGFASPAMVYVIVGIIAATFLFFLVLRPS
jgi:hypothetical protein